MVEQFRRLVLVTAPGSRRQLAEEAMLVFGPQTRRPSPGHPLPEETEILAVELLTESQVGLPRSGCQEEKDILGGRPEEK